MGVSGGGRTTVLCDGVGVGVSGGGTTVLCVGVGVGVCVGLTMGVCVGVTVTLTVVVLLELHPVMAAAVIAAAATIALSLFVLCIFLPLSHISGANDPLAVSVLIARRH